MPSSPKATAKGTSRQRTNRQNHKGGGQADSILPVVNARTKATSRRNVGKMNGAAATTAGQRKKK